MKWRTGLNNNETKKGVSIVCFVKENGYAFYRIASDKWLYPISIDIAVVLCIQDKSNKDVHKMRAMVADKIQHDTYLCYHNLSPELLARQYTDFFEHELVSFQLINDQHIQMG